jgi:hypothetical protein
MSSRPFVGLITETHRLEDRRCSRPRGTRRSARREPDGESGSGDIYGFVVAGCLITMGTLGDRIGRRRLLMFGGATDAADLGTAGQADRTGARVLEAVTFES